MARRRSSPNSPTESDRSSADLDDNISLMVADSHDVSHGHDHLHLHPESLTLTSSMHRSLLKCRSCLLRSSPPHSYSNNNNNKTRFALIVCLGLVAVTVIAFGIPSRLLTTRQDGTHPTNNNNNNNIGEGFLRASSSSPEQEEELDDINEFLWASHEHSYHDHDEGDGDGADSVEQEQENENELLQALYELPLPTTQEELDDINEELADLDPSFILQWAHHHLLVNEGEGGTSGTQHTHTQHARPLVQVTSFGPTGLVILHLLSQLHFLKDVPIITMDTLHLFPESYDFYDTIQSHYTKHNKLEDLVITKPLRIEYPPEMNGDGVLAGVFENRKDFEEAHDSTTMWKDDPKKFAQLTKIDPLNKALDEWQTQMWITGRRRSSGGERSTMHVLEFAYHRAEDNGEVNDDMESDYQPFDTTKGRWKLNPLAYHTYDQVWQYIRKYELPYNVLYDKGYTSLGDEMTTGLPQQQRDNHASKKNADGAGDAFERSGRFIGMGNQTECGLHSHLKKVKELKQQALESGEELDVPTLPCDKCIDLNIENFEERVTSGEEGQELLIEFYSPYCGGCKNFAPTIDRLANHLSSLKVPSIRVARFDITEHDAPEVNNENMFVVEVTPTLYRVRYTPGFHVELYKGEGNFDSILRWLTYKPKTKAKTTSPGGDDEAGRKGKMDLLKKKEDGGSGGGRRKKLVGKKDEDEDSYDAAVYRGT